MNDLEPIWTNFTCIWCGHRWQAFFPDGINSSDVECPLCGKMTPAWSDI